MAFTKHQKNEYRCTELECYLDCARRWKYRYKENIRPLFDADALRIGTWGHKALEDYYSKRANPRTVFMAQVPDDASATILEEAERVAQVLDRYLLWAKDQDQFEVLATEYEWRLRMPSMSVKGTSSHINGRYDMMVRDTHGRRWIVDHKFVKRMPNEEVLRLKSQITYYLWAGRQLFPNDPPVGLLINALKKEIPKSKDTQIFARYYQHRNTYELNNVDHVLYNIHKQMKEDSYYLAHPNLQCSWCDYKELCLAETDGVGYEDLIGWKYFIEEGDDTDDTSEA